MPLDVLASELGWSGRKTARALHELEQVGVLDVDVHQTVTANVNRFRLSRPELLETELRACDFPNPFPAS